MQIKQLEAFAEVIRLKSFSKAAGSMFLSQPSISAYVSSLEEELDTVLIIRSTKEIWPTEAGRRLYLYANEILDTVERAKRDIKSMQVNVSGILRCASSTVPSQYIIPGIFSSLSKKYKDLRFELVQSDSRGVISAVESFDAEVGVVGSKAVTSKCNFRPLCKDRLVLITPNTEEYANIREKDTDAILKCRFILREEGSGTLQETENFLKKHGKGFGDLDTVCRLGSTESVKQAVCEGLGVSFISGLAAADYERDGKIKIIDLKDESLTRNFYIVTHKERPLSPAAKAFIEMGVQ